MTRSEKIKKLANAIKDYRGAYEQATGKWIRPPKRNALVRVIAWLERLKLDPAFTLNKINAFKDFDAMNAWLNTL